MSEKVVNKFLKIIKSYGFEQMSSKLSKYCN